MVFYEHILVGMTLLSDGYITLLQSMCERNWLIGNFQFGHLSLVGICLWSGVLCANITLLLNFNVYYFKDVGAIYYSLRCPWIQSPPMKKDYPKYATCR